MIIPDDPDIRVSRFDFVPGRVGRLNSLLPVGLLLRQSVYPDLLEFLSLIHI